MKKFLGILVCSLAFGSLTAIADNYTASVEGTQRVFALLNVKSNISLEALKRGSLDFAPVTLSGKGSFGSQCNLTVKPSDRALFTLRLERLAEIKGVTKRFFEEIDFFAHGKMYSSVKYQSFKEWMKARAHLDITNHSFTWHMAEKSTNPKAYAMQGIFLSKNKFGEVNVSISNVSMDPNVSLGDAIAKDLGQALTQVAKTESSSVEPIEDSLSGIECSVKP